MWVFPKYKIVPCFFIKKVIKGGFKSCYQYFTVDKSKINISNDFFIGFWRMKSVTSMLYKDDICVWLLKIKLKMILANTSNGMK